VFSLENTEVHDDPDWSPHIQPQLEQLCVTNETKLKDHEPHQRETEHGQFDLT